MENYLSFDSVFEFGKFKGFKVGLIFLLDPQYIEWLLCKTDKYLIDIEDAKAIKVLNTRKVNMFLGDVAYEIITDCFLANFNFEELIYLGLDYYTFSEEAINKNNTKISNANLHKKKRTFYYDENKIFFRGFYCLKDRTYTDFFEVKCLELLATSKNVGYVVFEFDNTNKIIPSLPFDSECKFAALIMGNWKYSVPEMLDFVNKNELVKIRFVDGVIDFL